jgi:hypothetical protein
MNEKKGEFQKMKKVLAIALAFVMVASLAAAPAHPAPEATEAPATVSRRNRCSVAEEPLRPKCWTPNHRGRLP